MKTILTMLAILALTAVEAQQMNADEIINACIQKHGGEHYENAHYSFDFRKHHYEFLYHGGRYIYQRHLDDGKTKDILSNAGFKRLVDGKEVELTERKSRGYSNSVNSVHYFAFLPFFLNDKAVHKKLLGSSTIRGKEYYKVEVTFDQEGGGDDHDDVYIYWIGKEDFSMDYLAYSYHVNGGGVRFRAAYNPRTIGGIVFQDYINYKHDKETPVATLDALYEKGELKELSKIELKNITRIEDN